MAGRFTLNPAVGFLQNIEDALNDMRISDMQDVDLAAIANGVSLVYNTGTSKWECQVIGGASTDWGDIGGTLSNQTDLQSALNAKLGTSANAASASVLNTARKINGVSFDGSADIITAYYLNILSDLGSAIKSHHFMGPINVFSSGSLVNQRQIFQAVWLPKATTITGVGWLQIVSGDYTANNYNGVGLYTYSGGTLTLVASSTDDGNIWKATATSVATKAFSSTYNASAGLYFIGALWCRSAQVTAPTIATWATINTLYATLDLTNSAKLSSFLSAQTSLPASPLMSGNTTDGAPKYFFLY